MKSFIILLLSVLLFAKESSGQQYYKFYTTGLNGVNQRILIEGQNTPDIYWQSNKINVSFINTHLPSNITFEHAQEALQAAVDQWNNLNYYSINVVEPLEIKKAVIYFDSDNSAFEVMPGEDDAYSAFTPLAVESSNHIQYSVDILESKSGFPNTGILLNKTDVFMTQNTWITGMPLGYQVDGKDEVHMQSVLLHELGHLLGQSHNTRILPNSYSWGDPVMSKYIKNNRVVGNSKAVENPFSTKKLHKDFTGFFAYSLFYLNYS